MAILEFITPAGPMFTVYLLESQYILAKNKQTLNLFMNKQNQ